MPPAGPNEGTLRFDDFELDLRDGELHKSGHRIRLQEQPFRILAILIQKRGQVVTRDELCEQLWPADTFVDFDHSLNTAVKKLRQALSDGADAPRYIETLPKRGYRFIGKVEPPSDVTAVAVSPESKLQPPAEQTRRIFPIRFLAACAVAFLAVAGILIYLGRRPVPFPRITGARPLVR